jgi:acyl carrier protein
MEAVLRDIWCNLLGVSSVSSSSNFFVEGGDSEKLIQLAMEIKKELQVELPLLAIFEAQEFGNLKVEVGKRLEQVQANGGLVR